MFWAEVGEGAGGEGGEAVHEVGGVGVDHDLGEVCADLFDGLSVVEFLADEEAHL